MPKRTVVLLALVVAVLAAACSDAMTVQDGDTVEVHYVGTLDNGEQFDSSRDRGETFTFTVASGDVVPGFDDAVRGLKVGEIRVYTMPPQDGYGVWSEDNVFEVPYGESQSDVAVGDEVFLNTGRPAVILEVKEETVVLDANHFLADEALTFEVEVISITRPTEG